MDGEAFEKWKEYREKREKEWKESFEKIIKEGKEVGINWKDVKFEYTDYDKEERKKLFKNFKFLSINMIVIL